MPIPKEDIKTSIKAAMDEAYAVTDPAERDAAIDAWAGKLADAIVQAIDGTDVAFSLTDGSGAPVAGTITLNEPTA